MEIGEEIKQSKFRDEYQKLVINLGFTSSWAERISSCKLKSFKLGGKRLIRVEDAEAFVANAMAAQ